MSSAPQPPLVDGLPLLGSLLPLQRDALRFFTECFDTHGDRVRLRVLGKDVLLLTHPDDLQQVLITDRDSYGRSVELQNLRPVFGQGLLISEGSTWRQQRRILQPKFTQAAMRGYAEGMAEAMCHRTESWTSGSVVDAHAEMMSYTRDVICRLLFGSADTASARRVGESVRVVFGDLRAEILFLPLWRRLPLKKSRRWHHAVLTLNAAIADIIASRGDRSDSNDLLDVLLHARDEDGMGMSTQQVHDEVMTVFLAGHETSAVMLAWVLGLLAQHPALQEQAIAEAMEAGDTLDASKLPFLTAVVQETMRLYPPVWSMGRLATRDTSLGDTQIRKGTHLWLCLHRTHRDARWWNHPSAFEPERWMSGAPVRHSYIPFGLGPRMCLGQHLAMLEAVLGLSRLLQRVRLEAVQAMPEPEAWITLRPRGGMPVRVVSHGR